jgi:hypothetical protein
LTDEQPLEIEQIPDADKVARLIDRPHKYDDVKQVIWENAFIFPGGSESVCWEKYLKPPGEIHALGREWQTDKRLTKPAMTYIGYLEGVVGPIRAFKTRRGHGFNVVHAPSEGIHHAEVQFRRADGNEPFDKNDKSELKIAIKGLFGPLVRYGDT